MLDEIDHAPEFVYECTAQHWHSNSVTSDRPSVPLSDTLQYCDKTASHTYLTCVTLT